MEKQYLSKGGSVSGINIDNLEIIDSKIERSEAFWKGGGFYFMDVTNYY